MFEISAILLRAGPTRSENSSGPGRLYLKILLGRAGPTRAENSSGPGRLGLKILPGRADLGRKFLRAGDFKHWFQVYLAIWILPLFNK